MTSHWWERAGSASEAGAVSARRSVYEHRFASADPVDAADWTPLWELDSTGRMIEPPAPGWERRVTGWQSLDELLGR